MGLEAAELARWTRFAAKGGIGKCVATCDCVAESADDLMFLKDDEITVLLQLPDREGFYLGYCEGVVGRFSGAHVHFLGKLKKPVMAKRVSSSASVHSSVGGISTTATTLTSASPSPSTTFAGTTTSPSISTSTSASSNTYVHAQSPSPSVSTTMSSSSPTPYLPQLQSHTYNQNTGYNQTQTQTYYNQGTRESPVPHGAGGGAGGGAAGYTASLRRKSTTPSPAPSAPSAITTRSISGPSPSTPFSSYTTSPLLRNATPPLGVSQQQQQQEGYGRARTGSLDRVERRGSPAQGYGQGQGQRYLASPLSGGGALSESEMEERERESERREAQDEDEDKGGTNAFARLHEVEVAERLQREREQQQREQRYTTSPREPVFPPSIRNNDARGGGGSRSAAGSRAGSLGSVGVGAQGVFGGSGGSASAPQTRANSPPQAFSPPQTFSPPPPASYSHTSSPIIPQTTLSNAPLPEGSNTSLSFSPSSPPRSLNQQHRYTAHAPKPLNLAPYPPEVQNQMISPLRITKRSPVPGGSFSVGAGQRSPPPSGGLPLVPSSPPGSAGLRTFGVHEKAYAQDKDQTLVFPIPPQHNLGLGAGLGLSPQTAGFSPSAFSASSGGTGKSSPSVYSSVSVWGSVPPSPLPSSSFANASSSSGDVNSNGARGPGSAVGLDFGNVGLGLAPASAMSNWSDSPSHTATFGYRMGLSAGVEGAFGVGGAGAIGGDGGVGGGDTVGSSPSILQHEGAWDSVVDENAKDQSRMKDDARNEAKEVQRGRTEEQDTSAAADTAAGVSIGLSLLEGMMGGYSDDEDEDSDEDDTRRNRINENDGNGVGKGEADRWEGGSEDGTVEGLGYARSEEDHGVGRQVSLKQPQRDANANASGSSSSSALSLSPKTSPTSPLFPSNTHDRRPSLAPSASSVYSIHSTKSTKSIHSTHSANTLARSERSARSDTMSSWEGAADIYDDYRYSRFDAGSVRSGGSSVRSMAVGGGGSGVGGRERERRPSEGSVGSWGTGAGRRERVDSAARRLEGLVEGRGEDEEAHANRMQEATNEPEPTDQKRTTLTPAEIHAAAMSRRLSTKHTHTHTASVDSEASVYTQNSRLSMLSRELELGGVLAGTEGGAGVESVRRASVATHANNVNDNSSYNANAHVDATNSNNNSKPTELLLHTSWGSALSSPDPSTAGLDGFMPVTEYVDNEKEVVVRSPTAGGAMGFASLMRMRIEEDKANAVGVGGVDERGVDGDESADGRRDTLGGLGRRIVVEDEDELPSRIMDSTFDSQADSSVSVYPSSSNDLDGDAEHGDENDPDASFTSHSTTSANTSTSGHTLLGPRRGDLGSSSSHSHEQKLQSQSLSPSSSSPSHSPSRSSRRRASNSSPSPSPEPELLGALGTHLAPLMVTNRTPSPSLLEGLSDDGGRSAGIGGEGSSVAASNSNSNAGSPVPALAPDQVATGGQAPVQAPAPISHLRPRTTNTLAPISDPNGPQRQSLFLPHPGAPKAPPPQGQPGPGQRYGPGPYQQPPPPMMMMQGQGPIRPNVFSAIRMALAMSNRPGGPPHPPQPPTPVANANIKKGPTIYGRLDGDLGNALGPVPVWFTIDPPPATAPPPGSVPRSQSPVGAIKSRGPQAGAPPVVGGGSPGKKMQIMVKGGGPGVGGMRSLSMGVAAGQGSKLNPGAGGSGGESSIGLPAPIPRAGFVPMVGGVRPRSRSFSGFHSGSAKSDVPLPLSRGEDGARVRSLTPSSSSGAAMSASSSMSGTSMSTSATSISISPSSSVNINTNDNESNSNNKNALKIPKLKPSTSSPALSTLAFKPPSSPLAQVVFSRTPFDRSHEAEDADLKGSSSTITADSNANAANTVGGADAHGDGNASRPAPVKKTSLGQPQFDLTPPGPVGGVGRTASLQALPRETGLLSLSSSSSSSSMSNTNTNLKSTHSMLDLHGAAGRSSLSGSDVTATIRAQMMVSPPPAPPAGGVVRQTSLRSKLSLPNLRRKQSRMEDEGSSGSGAFTNNTNSNLNLNATSVSNMNNGLPSGSSSLSPLPNSGSSALMHDPEMLQVKDIEFELVRPNLAQHFSQAARASEDSAVLGREGGGSFDFGNGRKDTSSFLRAESPAFSITSGAAGGGSGSGSGGSLMLGPKSPTMGDAGWSQQRQMSINSSSSLSMISNAPPPPPPTALATADGTSIEAHRSRELKWMSLMSSNPASQARKSKKVKKLLTEGVPSSVRYLVWIYLTNGKDRCVPGVYKTLCERTKVDVAGRIERDVMVAFGGEGEEYLRGTQGGVVCLLSAYLNMVPDVQYSMGLTLIVGQLLLLAPEEDAFWIFVSIMDTHIRAYFSATTTQMEVDAALFSRALENNDAQVAKKLFVDMGISPTAICGPWFSTLFVGSLPLEYLNRIWDLFLFEGVPFLLRVGLALIQCCRRNILEATSEESVLQDLRHPWSSVLPSTPDALLAMVFSVKVKDDDVRKQRVKMEAQVKRQTQVPRTASTSGVGMISLPRT